MFNFDEFYAGFCVIRNNVERRVSLSSEASDYYQLWVPRIVDGLPKCVEFLDGIVQVSRHFETFVFHTQNNSGEDFRSQWDPHGYYLETFFEINFTNNNKWWNTILRVVVEEYFTPKIWCDLKFLQQYSEIYSLNEFDELALVYKKVCEQETEIYSVINQLTNPIFGGQRDFDAETLTSVIGALNT